jgi:hypothetical protein
MRYILRVRVIYCQTCWMYLSISPYATCMPANLCLSGNRSHTADLATFQSVNYAAFTHIRISDEAHRNLFLVRVELGKLPEKLYERSFSKGVVGRCVESDCGEAWGEVLNISRLWSECIRRNTSQ